MEFPRLLKIVGDEPLFETGLLLAGNVDAKDIRRQLSRWTKAGKLYQVRRGLYAPAPPFQKVEPHPFLVANRMARGSYVSTQSALAHYGLIPEYVPVVTSVTPTRPGRWDTPLGSYEFRHLKKSLLTGYRLTAVADGQQAFIALPEKALLDLIYLHPGADSPAYLQELRLQNLDRLHLTQLQTLVDSANSPKLQRAAAFIAQLMQKEVEEYETL